MSVLGGACYTLTSMNNPLFTLRDQRRNNEPNLPVEYASNREILGLGSLNLNTSQILGSMNKWLWKLDS
jgi:hypothetical protein